MVFFFFCTDVVGEETIQLLELPQLEVEEEEEEIITSSAA